MSFTTAFIELSLLYKLHFLSLFSSKYLQEEEMNCNIYTDRKAFYRVKWLIFEKNPTLTYEVPYIKLFTLIECRVFGRAIFRDTKISN